MRIYDCFAGLLVDDGLCHWYVKAKNERQAWLKGYGLAMNSPVADSGDVDCKRITVDKVPAGAKIY